MIEQVANVQPKPVPSYDLPVVYTNYDHKLDDDVVRDVVEQGGEAAHTAWDFFGVVWKQDGHYYESVMVRHIVVATFRSDELAELVDHVANEYGRE